MLSHDALSAKATTMVSHERFDEYVKELRKEVCGRCDQTAPSGPPCTPLGWPFEIEIYLPESVALAHSPEPRPMYVQLAEFQEFVCESCARGGQLSHCPISFLSPNCPRCPLTSSTGCRCAPYRLLPLAIKVIRAVDARHDDADPSLN